MPAFSPAASLVLAVSLWMFPAVSSFANSRVVPERPVPSSTKSAAKASSPVSSPSLSVKRGEPALPAGGSALINASVAPLPRVYAPTRPREVAPRYPWRRNITTTVFWVGEAPSGRNLTPNHKSSWDTRWQENFGGFDDPNRENRTYDFHPRNFVPKLNPFYVALPFNDKTNEAIAAARIPWFKTRKHPESNSACHGMWLAVRFGNKTCFAQWEDCGPFTTDDHNYVFGTAPPKNPENNGAGLDVSPAVRDFLGIASGAQCDWRFCTPDEVPDGPWTRFGDGRKLATSGGQNIDAIRAKYDEMVRQREDWLKRNPAAR